MPINWASKSTFILRAYISLVPRVHTLVSSPSRGSGDIQLILQASLKIIACCMHRWELINNLCKKKKSCALSSCWIRQLNFVPDPLPIFCHLRSRKLQPPIHKSGAVFRILSAKQVNRLMVKISYPPLFEGARGESTVFRTFL